MYIKLIFNLYFTWFIIQSLKDSFYIKKFNCRSLTHLREGKLYTDFLSRVSVHPVKSTPGLEVTQVSDVLCSDYDYTWNDVRTDGPDKCWRDEFGGVDDLFLLCTQEKWRHNWRKDKRNRGPNSRRKTGERVRKKR